MKILFFILFLLFSLENVFAVGDTTDPLYEDYKNNIENLCNNTSSVGWSDWQKNSFVKISPIYANINKQEEGDVSYKVFLKTIKADDSKISDFGSNPSTRMTPVFLDKASYVYKETMSTIYACAVMNVRIRTINMIFKTKSVNSNLRESLEKELKSTKDKLENKGCLLVTDTSELSLKKVVLDNTTYQYCNYRYYLNYLDNASKNSINVFFSGSTKQTEGIIPRRDTTIVTEQIMGSASKITAEILHTKEIFPQAMIAFGEFEKTYAAHIILQFILQDYIDLRTTLKSLMNPISQVIYKASNAQAP